MGAGFSRLASPGNHAAISQQKSSRAASRAPLTGFPEFLGCSTSTLFRRRSSFPQLPPLFTPTFASEFDVAHEEGGLYILTMHPHVIGHRSRIAVLEKLIGSLAP